jgi:phosphopantetheine--protein transferase-like protein
MRVGTDIVYIADFNERFAKNRWKFEQDVFFEGELGNGSMEHLAGVFAAKEAAIKALDLVPGSWKAVEIKKRKSGKPELLLHNGKDRIKNCGISISHAGDYATAVVVCK